jgi:hypothetical protein
VKDIAFARTCVIDQRWTEAGDAGAARIACAPIDYSVGTLHEEVKRKSLTCVVAKRNGFRLKVKGVFVRVESMELRRKVCQAILVLLLQSFLYLSLLQKSLPMIGDLRLRCL